MRRDRRRHDMVTHYTIDDLRVALGFARPRPDERTARADEHDSAHPGFDADRPHRSHIERDLECTSLHMEIPDGART